MSKPAGLSEFWKEVLRLLGQCGKNESWLARRLGVPIQTLSSWKQRNQFRRACLDQLGELLHWQGLDEESAAQLGVELIEGRVPAKAESHPTEEAAAADQPRVSRRGEDVHARMPATPSRVLHTLGEHCFYAFTAPTNTPYEFENTPEGHAIAVAIARALVKGTLCLYIRPNEEGISYYRDTWGYGQLVYQKHAIEEIAAFRAQLKGWLVRGEVEGQPKIGAAEADRILHERLDQCYVTRSPMWMPGVSLSMIGWTHARELKARMTISLPGARFGGMLVYPRYLTLEFRFMRFLRAVVLEACKEIQARRRRKDGRPGGTDPPGRREEPQICRAVLREVFPIAAVGL